MRFLAGSIVCALLTGCQTVPPAPQDIGPPDAISFEVKSWGAPIHSWTFAADGSATSIVRHSETGSPRAPYTLEHRRFALASETVARLGALAEDIPRPVPSDDHCHQRVTDAAYGTLSLSRDGKTEALPFYEGCYDAYYAPYLAKVKEIDALVMAQSSMARIERLEDPFEND